MKREKNGKWKKNYEFKLREEIRAKKKKRKLCKGEEKN